VPLSDLSCTALGREAHVNACLDAAAAPAPRAPRDAGSSGVELKRPRQPEQQQHSLPQSWQQQDSQPQWGQQQKQWQQQHGDQHASELPTDPAGVGAPPPLAAPSAAPAIGGAPLACAGAAAGVRARPDLLGLAGSRPGSSGSGSGSEETFHDAADAGAADDGQWLDALQTQMWDEQEQEEQEGAAGRVEAASAVAMLQASGRGIGCEDGGDGDGAGHLAAGGCGPDGEPCDSLESW
jgi:hypothetical protein